MALSPLAMTADLTEHNISWRDLPAGTSIDALLDSASSAIRDAAGSVISLRNGTIEVSGGCDEWLDFPLPIVSVDTVTINGEQVTGWKLRGGRLWRSNGWRPGHGNDIAVTGHLGLLEVPSDIVDLACSLVAAGIAAVQDGYDPQRGLTSLSIDDYREGYAKGDDEVISPFDLPDRTRQWLRARFGTTAHVTGHR